VAVVAGLSVLGGLHAAGAQSSGEAPRLADDPELVATGEDLFALGCSSCHGLRGEGPDNGPYNTGAGAAAADFQLRTGRMPAAGTQGQQPPKDPTYDDDQIRALVAYVGSLGDGPLIPDVDPDRGDLANGGELYRANCAACHNATGIGGALSYGSEAPSVRHTEPVQVGEAMRTGPGQMPVFGPDSFSSQELDDIAAYVRELREPSRRGGLSLGSVGPVAEGFVAVLIALGGIVLALRWITARTPGHDAVLAPDSSALAPESGASSRDGGGS
jgi:ubiquinol-cytochrome c reductase cytochrome c subunit